MEFLTSKELALNPAGYLVSKTSKKPVTHTAFVDQQRAAEYVVKLAAAISGKTFKAGKLDNLEAIKAEVKAAINATDRTYVTAPSKPVSKINDELIKFALDFDKYEDEKGQSAKINTFMNQFNSISDVESVGDYFSEGVVKLNVIYDIKTILEAVKANVAKLDNM